MTMNSIYTDNEPARAELDALNTPILVEFGAPWCTHCQAAQALIAEAFIAHPSLKHLKIEDGRGKLLGRSFGVKLWPTLIAMKNGREIARLVRPESKDLIAKMLANLEHA